MEASIIAAAKKALGSVTFNAVVSAEFFPITLVKGGRLEIIDELDRPDGQISFSVSYSYPMNQTGQEYVYHSVKIDSIMVTDGEPERESLQTLRYRCAINKLYALSPNPSHRDFRGIPIPIPVWELIEGNGNG